MLEVGLLIIFSRKFVLGRGRGLLGLLVSGQGLREAGGESVVPVAGSRAGPVTGLAPRAWPGPSRVAGAVTGGVAGGGNSGLMRGISGCKDMGVAGERFEAGRCR